MTSIEITNEIENQWRDFMKYQPIFSKMLEMGVFEKDNIQVTLYFNKFSSLTAVDKTKRMLVNHKKHLQVA